MYQNRAASIITKAALSLFHGLLSAVIYLPVSFLFLDFDLSCLNQQAVNLLISENTILPGTLSQDEELLTSKTEDGHGNGLSNIRKVCEKHEGALTHTILDNSFISTAIIQV